jgi:biotin operon repressor
MKLQEVWEELDKLEDKGVNVRLSKDFGDSLLISLSNWEEE